MDDIRGYLIIGIVIAAVLEHIRSIRVFRDVQRKYPVVKLEGKLKRDKWRLREPPAQLGPKVLETSDKSVFDFPARSGLVEKFVNIGGYVQILLLLVALTVGVAKSLFARSHPSTDHLMPGVIFLFLLGWLVVGRLFLLIGEKVIRIELQPGAMQLITRYGFFLHRRFRFRPNRNLIIESKLILERDEKEPFFVMVFRWKWLRWTSLFRRKMTFCVNPSQCSWLSAELKDWNRRLL
jgi:hypothetical protein